MRFKWNKQWGIPVIAGGASFVVGSGIGYVTASIRLSKKIKDIEVAHKALRAYLDEHIEKKEEEKREPTAFEKLVEEPVIDISKDETMIAQHREESGLPQVEDSTPDLEDEELVLEPVEIRTNIFASDPDDDWDYDHEVQKRGDRDPYIIHRDEFMDEESGFSQSSLTYYRGDNILCDEKDAPIYNHEFIAGTLRFGHGSKDPNIVYVRNPQLQAEYEIILDTGYYEIEVLGATLEDQAERDLRHTSLPRFRKD